ncbi:MAG: FimV/HubP family polar landmark protein [Lautropia sp.]|nr:FimV/HubP family polar landmark protein [Lautropia sp.]
MSEQPRSKLHSITSGGAGRAQLASAVALALAFLAGGSSPAEAAGLGRLTVQSALGQPLRAEVEVTSVRPDEAASLTAKLATPDAFSKAGLQYKEALSAVQMAVEERNGRYVIKLSSSRPINEPFVDLMVELSWAAGKFVREYTFLLDPPIQRQANQQTSRAGAPVVGAAGSTAATASMAQPAASGVRTIDPVTGRLISPDRQQRAASASANRPSREQQPRQAARPTSSSPAAAGGAAAGTSSVVVGEGETLGIIAARVRPASATLEQTIVAIYRNNPSAFIQNNPNLIRQGRTLDIPSEGEIVSVDSAEATRQLRVAARDFRSYKERLAAVPVEVGNQVAGTTASGSISAKVDDQAGKSADVDRLELSRSDESTDKSASAIGARDAEALVAREAALKEANSRIVELERNVNDLQRMLELKNKSLADLQQQLEQSRAAGASVSGAVAAAGTAAAEKAKAAADKAAAEKAAAEQAAADKLAADKAAAEAKAKEAADKLAAEKAAQEKALAEKMAAEKAAAEKAAADMKAKAEAEAKAVAEKLKAGEADTKAAAEKAAADAKAELDKVTTDGDKAGQAKPVPPVQKPAEEPAADEQPGLIEGLAQSPMVLPVLGVFAVIAGLGYMVLRRRRRDEDGFGDSIGADEFTANSLFGTTGGQSVDTMTGGTTQITTISESTPTEVDPIAEAEVYIAYGRETQAEEILREALKRQPERQAIRLKLLEIFSGRKDTVAFSQMAREMHEMTGGMNEEWPRVASMGATLDPDNPLYGDGSQAPAAAPAQDAFAGMGAAAAVAAGVAAAQSASAESSAPVADEVAASVEVAEQPAEDMGLAFESNLDQSLAELDADVAEPANDTQGVGFPATRSGPLAAMPSVELPSLDLDAPLDLDDGPSTVTDLSMDTSIEDSLSIQAESSDVGDEADLASIGLDLSPSTISGPITMSGAASSQWQEMASKLDLASAYTEIGDKEGARELLEEVLTGGDAVQQQRARDMLAEL